MTQKFLTSHAVRDTQGRFTGRYKLGLNWARIAPASQRKIPRAWAVVQLLILVMTLAYMGA
jgi:hypothetical protein